MASLPAGAKSDQPAEKQEKQRPPSFKHSLLFENPNGIPTLMKQFPDAVARLKGTGEEFKDLTRLMDFYRTWARDLYPYGLHFDDFVKKLEKSLGGLEKRTNLHEDDSDPQEHLLKLRFLHKMGVKVEDVRLTAEERKRRLQEGRQIALAKRAKRLEANKKLE